MSFQTDRVASVGGIIVTIVQYFLVYFPFYSEAILEHNFRLQQEILILRIVFAQEYLCQCNYLDFQNLNVQQF